MPKVYNKRNKDAPEGAVYVGRPGPYGNPFTISTDGTRKEVIRKFREFICSPDNRSYLETCKRELKGKDLVCWCAPLPCHADVLLEIANQ